MNCVVCGWPLQRGNTIGCCQRNKACKREYHLRADRPKPTQIEVLAMIFALIPGMQRSVAEDIAVAMSKKDRQSVRKALERFAAILDDRLKAPYYGK